MRGVIKQHFSKSWQDEIGRTPAPFSFAGQQLA
jgi:hypothetical protein